jgi:hypothetical protein
MSKHSLKTIIHKYVDTSDDKILKVVHTILEQHAKLKLDDNLMLSETEINELDKRWISYKNGTNKTHSLEAVKMEVRKKLKTAKQG